MSTRNIYTPLDGTLVQKGPQKGTAPKQLQNHKVSTVDVENTNGTN